MLIFQFVKFWKFVNFPGEGLNFEQSNFRMANISNLKINEGQM